jgi:hypothetical protein
MMATGVVRVCAGTLLLLLSALLAVRSAKFVARKQWVVCGADDMQLRVYNYNTMDKIKTFEAHTDYIRSAITCRMIAHSSRQRQYAAAGVAGKAAAADFKATACKAGWCTAAETGSSKQSCWQRATLLHSGP